MGLLVPCLLTLNNKLLLKVVTILTPVAVFWIPLSSSKSLVLLAAPFTPETENFPLSFGVGFIACYFKIFVKCSSFSLSIMLIPIFKFVIFSVSLVLLFIWSNSPDLWVQISSSVLRASNNSSNLLYFVEDLPGRVHELLIYSEHLVKSLTCDNLDPSLLDLLPDCLQEEYSPLFMLPVKEPQPISQSTPGSQDQSTQRTPWLLAGMGLMGLNFYFPQLSFLSSL
ncbi:hypothetical protein DSO57_1004971 [Entomophthora muscae]|uniref:Uncharacterized protein n=1 Tax=Entomophthora muscae TaxID=34485 RepID=A0ACC2U647_9FUNG|nr:hypothetical protein DSO57_1004971 [Entomophthora muscae]